MAILPRALSVKSADAAGTSAMGLVLAIGAVRRSPRPWPAPKMVILWTCGCCGSDGG